MEHIIGDEISIIFKNISFLAREEYLIDP